MATDRNLCHDSNRFLHVTRHEGRYRRAMQHRIPALINISSLLLTISIPPVSSPPSLHPRLQEPHQHTTHHQTLALINISPLLLTISHPMSPCLHRLTHNSHLSALPLTLFNNLISSSSFSQPEMVMARAVLPCCLKSIAGI